MLQYDAAPVVTSNPFSVSGRQSLRTIGTAICATAAR